MDLGNDKRQKTPSRDSRPTGPGEAQETGGRETESELFDSDFQSEALPDGDL
jgi:hypothetical protein